MDNSRPTNGHARPVSSEGGRASNCQDSPPRDLLDRYRQGDREAFWVLWIRYLAILTWRASRILDDDADVADALGVTSDRLSRPDICIQFDPECSWLGWAWRDLSFRCLDIRRHRDRQRQYIQSGVTLDTLPGSESDPASQAAINEERALLREAIELLDHQDQLLLETRFGGGKCLREVAEVVGLTSASGVSHRLTRVIRKLRFQMTEQGLR